MRSGIVLVCVLAALAAGCGKPEKSKAPRSKSPAAQRSPAPTRDQGPRSSPLDNLASLPAEAAKPPTPRPAAAPPTATRWLVVSVHDGDTVQCLDDDKVQHKVRLVGIDAPEIGQAFGTVSRDGLRALVLRKTVTVRTEGEDRYGRTLGILEIDGQDVALHMLTAGLAWHFTRYSDDERRAAAEREARAAKRGLWADPKPEPPWEWRATEKDRRPAGRPAASRP
jgi:micrococcal nuclease